MIAEMRSRVLGEIFPELAKTPLNIYLVDGAPTVLPPMREKSQKYTKESLEKMGVIVKLNKMVSDYKDDMVYFKDGETIETKTLIWTAGVTAIKFEGIPEGSYERGNRLLVDEFSKVANTENIYAVGDSSIQYNDPDFPKGYPQLGSVAQQQGKNLAKNLAILAQNGSEKDLKPFEYTDKGTMAIIGKKRAVADLTFPNTTLTGFFAWFAWLFIHLFLLIDYRNRIRTMINWTGAYLNDSQSNGLMVGEDATSSLKEIMEEK